MDHIRGVSDKYLWAGLTPKNSPINATIFFVIKIKKINLKYDYSAE